MYMQKFQFILLVTLLSSFLLSGCGGGSANNNNNNNNNKGIKVTEVPNSLFDSFHIGFNGNCAFNSKVDGKKILMNSTDFVMDDTIAYDSKYQNIKDFNASAFSELHHYLKNSKYLVYWFVEGWEENWFDITKLQKAMDAGYIPVFNYWWFGDKLMNGMPDASKREQYAEDNAKVATFLSKLHGTKLLIMEPEFNKDDVLSSESNQHKFATIIGDAIERIKSNSQGVLFSLAMTDKGKRGLHQTYKECGYENCALGDKYEWKRPQIIYNDLKEKLDFISFEEMVGQFSRNPTNPGGWKTPNPFAYTDADIGIYELSQRIANLSQFLHEKYKKPIFLPYISIATATWSDVNDNGKIDDAEVNRSGWEREARSVYEKLSTKREELLAKGLFGFSPMALFDEPRHNYGGYQFFLNNEYHLGIIKSSAIDGNDSAANGDIVSKSGIVEIIFSKD